MGEVYRARDTTLGREVAIKVLPAGFADVETLARFEREARALAALNHPHVGAIYGTEDFAGSRALILELVEGETLADRIRRGPLPLGQALRIAGQIAGALDAAHKKGIIHRDLKPANIKVTDQGDVKVLDFGIAKIADARASDLSQSQTVTEVGTRQGVLLGTAGYMSPEQARGLSVDARTDIWAIGCVLYEMLTGRRAFDGPTVSDTVARILERDPDWSALPRSTTTQVRGLLQRCLAKDPHERPPDMSGVRALLDEWGRAPTTRQVAVRMPTVIAATISIAAVSLGAYWWTVSHPQGAIDPSRWTQLTDFPDSATQPALSPDGRMLAFIRGDSTFAGSGEVYLKHLPHGEATPLTRDGRLKMDPAFSPDGNRIAYTVTNDPSLMSTGWDTWQVPVVRGEPRRWLGNASGLRWVGPDQLLFSVAGPGSHMGIVLATEGRGDTREVYFPENKSRMAHRSALSPDGKWVIVVEMDERGVFTPCRLIPSDKTSPGRRVGPETGRCTSAAWAPDGRRMYFSVDVGEGFHLWRQRFPDGQPEQLTAGATTQEEGLAVDPDGRSLVTSVGQQRRGIWIHDSSGERQISAEGYAYWPLYSSDGRTLTFRVSRSIGSGSSPTELWMTDLVSGRLERLFPGQLVVQYDLSHDRILAAVLETDGKSRLWVAWLDGREAPRPIGRIEASSARLGPAGQVIFTAIEGGSLDMFRTNIDGAAPQRLGPGPSGGVLGTVSPDGLWVSDYLSGELRASSTSGGTAVTLLRGSVSRLRWTADGKRALLAVQSGPGPSAFGFGRTYVLPLETGSMLPRTPPGGFKTEADLAAAPGVDVIPYGDVAFSPNPGVYAFSKITVTRNLYRIPLP